jgi:DNA invertase Pin-like site-specific DNA recombinase
MGGLAEFERELILARTSDGRRRAKARGVRFGRPAGFNHAPAAGSDPQMSYPRRERDGGIDEALLNLPKS